MAWLQVSVGSSRQGNNIIAYLMENENENENVIDYLYDQCRDAKIQKIVKIQPKIERISKWHEILTAQNLPEIGRLPNLHDLGGKMDRIIYQNMEPHYKTEIKSRVGISANVWCNKNKYEATAVFYCYKVDMTGNIIRLKLKLNEVSSRYLQKIVH